MSLLKIFRKNATDLFNQSMNAIRTSFNDFDVDNLESNFEIMQKEFNEEFKKLKEKFKLLNNKHVVTVPFDKDTENLTFNIKNDVLTIEVNKNIKNETSQLSQTNTTQVSLPTGINIDNIIQKYNNKEKKMIFIIKTDVNQDVDIVNKNDGEKKDDENIERMETVNQNIENGQTSKEVEKDRLLRKIVNMKNNGCSIRQIAEETNLSVKTIYRWLKQYYANNNE